MTLFLKDGRRIQNAAGVEKRGVTCTGIIIITCTGKIRSSSVVRDLTSQKEEKEHSRRMKPCEQMLSHGKMERGE